MGISDKYNHTTSEEKWYSFWQENNFFHSTPDKRKPYTIVIPPPNVTGVLHMGHMLNNTIQDVLIRRARMNGFNACWVPGTDHASIATEAKVVNKLKEEGVTKYDIGREKFLEHAWDWTHKYGSTILEQLKKLGCSCDWDRTKFTMDEDMSESVIKTFIDLYNKGLIYRGYRMINWDPEAKTGISDEEVIFVEKNGKLYFLKYKIEGQENYITIATTRPETIFGDTAICINPNDERYKHLIGKNVIVPIANRIIPIIADEYVDIEFGTGCLKITPAHDQNDKLIGEKHKLPVVDIFNNNASLNQHGLHYAGKDRFVVRKEIEQELIELNLLEKVEPYANKVGTSERTNAVIEPKISVQWFMKMKDLAGPALDVVMSDEVKLYPNKFKNTYKHWMQNVHDWNISRQLWWGQQIPAYFYGSGLEDFVVAEDPKKALIEAQKKTDNPNLTAQDLKQDPDVLDTWFSSWLWPISVFDGVRNPNNEEINYYYPTEDLVTGPDILFFWVARMIMAGVETRKQIPFKNVYLTGIVRDKQRRKMSKSLGNSPDPLDLIKQYGADGIRVGLLLSSSAGNDLLFDENLCLQGRNFSNKIWNVFKLIKSWTPQDIEQPEASKQASEWFGNQFNATLKQINEDFLKFRISDALLASYKLVWDDFASWYLESIKPVYGEPINLKTYKSTVEYLENLMRLLHPFMPFLTEEIWQTIAERKREDALVISSFPKENDFSDVVLSQFKETQELISAIRNNRNKENISPKEIVKFIVPTKEENNLQTQIIVKLANVEVIFTDQKPENAMVFRLNKTEYALVFNSIGNPEDEKQKLNTELLYLEGFLKSVQNKLSNKRFVANAPENILSIERKKEADAIEKIELIKVRLNII